MAKRRNMGLRLPVHTLDELKVLAGRLGLEGKTSATLAVIVHLAYVHWEEIPFRAVDRPAENLVEQPAEVQDAEEGDC